MNQKRQPSYYAIIPSSVRYDKRLKFAERLLYGEITALLGKEGYCFASNNYFADLYGVIPGTISRWISHLDNLGYIKVDIIKNANKEVKERRIYIIDVSNGKSVDDTYEQNKQYPYEQNCSYPISKKAKGNNINIRIDRLFNYIINNKGKIPDDFENIGQFTEFYRIIERFEFNYTEELVKILNEENLNKLKIIIYTIKELFIRNKKEVLSNCNRHVFLDIYDNCKYIEKIYKNTDKEINNFYDYYYVSILKRYEAK